MLRFSHALPACLALACHVPPLATPEPVVEIEVQPRAEPRPMNEADVLFVIDNSRSMDDEQKRLEKAFPAFMRELENLKGGPPDLHIGIITTDVGGPRWTGCADRGGDGVLVGSGKCGLPDGVRFLARTQDGTQNFSGDLEATFTCLATVGTGGCGFEAPFEALRRALRPDNPYNQGFRRPGATLAIVILSDEDDCSVQDPSLLAGDIPGQTPSLRCALAGHVCNGATPGVPSFETPLGSCAAAPDEGGTLLPLESLTTLLGPSGPKTLIRVIAGYDPNASYKIAPSEADNGAAKLQPVCRSAPGEEGATPALRLRALAQAYDSDVTSICAASFDQVLQDLARTITNPQACPDRPLADSDPEAPGLQPECQVLGVRPDGIERALPACTDGGPRPCWTHRTTGTRCSGGVDLVVEEGQTPETQMVVGEQARFRCLACARPDQPGCGP